MMCFNKSVLFESEKPHWNKKVKFHASLEISAEPQLNKYFTVVLVLCLPFVTNRHSIFLRFVIKNHVLMISLDKGKYDDFRKMRFSVKRIPSVLRHSRDLY